MATDAFDSTFSTTFDDIGFKLAWAVEDHSTLEAKDDPNYVMMQALLRVQTNNVIKSVSLPFHKCTEDDWNEFYPPQASFVPSITSARQRHTYYCLDKGINPKLYGNDFTDFSRLNILYLPCAFNKSANCPYN